MKSQQEILAALMKECGLGEITEDIRPVSGGLMHKMYKVRTATGDYAVKCLNPEIMARPGVFENYARAEELEGILEEHEVPMVPAMTFSGRKMLEHEGMYFYVFHWMEGGITDQNGITEEQCFQAGEILGQIHRIDPQIVEEAKVSEDDQAFEPKERSVAATEITEPELSEINFREYLSLAKERKSAITLILEENLDLLEEAQNKLNEARKSLPQITAINDGDMDPKNIMWCDGKPYVIDLECLDRDNPVAACVDLALQWSGTLNGRFQKELLSAFFRGYLKAYDNGFQGYENLFGIAYTWVEWLEYNLRRALGLTGGDEEEIRLGEEETVSTIGRIRYLKSIEAEVCETFRSYFHHRM